MDCHKPALLQHGSSDSMCTPLRLSSKLGTLRILMASAQNSARSLVAAVCRQRHDSAHCLHDALFPPSSKQALLAELHTGVSATAMQSFRGVTFR